eukprot:4730646-Prorocentrum_lima.AAC.1
MTSSLVGSEMCIRDSCGCTASDSFRTSQSTSSRKRPSKPPHVERRNVPCLLYTSDAADDM